METLRKDKCLMWEIPPGSFHLSNDVLHLSHKVDAVAIHLDHYQG